MGCLAHLITSGQARKPRPEVVAADRQIVPFFSSKPANSTVDSPARLTFYCKWTNLQGWTGHLVSRSLGRAPCEQTLGTTIFMVLLFFS